WCGRAEPTRIGAGGSAGGARIVRAFAGAAIERNRAVEAAAGDDAAGARVLVGCGQSLPEQQITIVDPESQTGCAPGEVGEIWVAGPSVAQGYWERPAETAQTFRATLDGAGPFLR